MRVEVNPALALLDFIRNNQGLKATKIGCREGDCGACTLLRGKWQDGKLTYESIVSCLTPMAQVHGQHIVTLEGINLEKENPVQEAMAVNHASQCGFCTPGFVLSLTGFLMNDEEDVIQSISGNICRCTGYKSIERAAEVIRALKKTFGDEDRIEHLVRLNCLPEYFLGIGKKLSEIQRDQQSGQSAIMIGGGSDLMVQRPGELMGECIIPSRSLFSDQIVGKENGIHIGGAVSIHDFFDHPLIEKYFPAVYRVKRYFASDPIRHMGTLTGNIVNASPIGDLTITLLALNAKLDLVRESGEEREVFLKDFYLSYKHSILQEGEHIRSIILPLPGEGWHFHFYKVSKRTHLDIASVNSAVGVGVEDGHIQRIDLALGGVAAIPFLARESMQFLKGKELNLVLLQKAWKILHAEVQPISDIRGSSEYKWLLLRQQFFGHFQYLFPGIIDEKELHDLLTKELMHEKY